MYTFSNDLDACVQITKHKHDPININQYDQILKEKQREEYEQLKEPRNPIFKIVRDEEASLKFLRFRP